MSRPRLHKPARRVDKDRCQGHESLTLRQVRAGPERIGECPASMIAPRAGRSHASSRQAILVMRPRGFGVHRQQIATKSLLAGNRSRPPASPQLRCPWLGDRPMVRRHSAVSRLAHGKLATGIQPEGEPGIFFAHFTRIDTLCLDVASCRRLASHHIRSSGQTRSLRIAFFVAFDAFVLTCACDERSV